MASITRAARREWGRLRSVLSYLRREVKVRHTPLHLWIELTDKCNLRCVMCINSVVTKRHSGFMDMGLYRSIIDQVAGWRPKPLLSLFLGGESTLHPGIFEMISYADRKGLSTFLATNATTLTPTRSRRLIESGLENIIFSFDGYDKESYESVRVGANFERTVENIHTFLKIKRELNSKTPRVTLSSLITRSFEEEGERAKLEEFQHTFDWTASRRVQNQRSRPLGWHLRWYQYAGISGSGYLRRSVLSMFSIMGIDEYSVGWDSRAMLCGFLGRDASWERCRATVAGYLERATHAGIPAQDDPARH